MDFNSLLRANIRRLKPYASARDEFQGEAAIFLDANENPYDTGYNRYPDPYQRILKERIAELKQVHPDRIFLGNGSDEAIDLLLRAFCEPHKDNIVSIEPSYGMYRVCADTHGIEVKSVLLEEDFSLNHKAILKEKNKHSKIIFLCSPNNPTGNNLDPKGIEKILKKFKGLVVVDEAYIDFCPDETKVSWLEEYPNLVILQTFSKAWGLAGIRLGMAFAHPELIRILNKIKMPYNINTLTQEYALEALEKVEEKENYVEEILAARTAMFSALKEVKCVEKIYPSSANFILVKVDEATKLYHYLIERGIVVRNRSNVALCEGCLRLTVGTSEENTALLQGMERFSFKEEAA